MAATQPNPRASLLAGLRTGGVRSTSMTQVPHTAAPGGSFNVSRFTSASHAQFTEEPGGVDEVSDIQDIYVNPRSNCTHQAPMTSAVDGAMFSLQQNLASMATNGGNPFGPGITPQAAQAFQMQMMQMEIIRLQAIQAQQYQTELLAQTQRQQQQQQRSQPQGWRDSSNPPASAGPYDLRFAAAMNNQMRSNQADQLRSKLGVFHNDEPMTASLNGKFGSRKSGEEDGVDFTNPPATPSRTTVISGGTVLGSPMSNNINLNGGSTVPSKSDSAVSWRRNGKNNSVLSGNRAMSLPAPTVKVTPPPGESAPTSPIGVAKNRPQPLRFNLAVSQPHPAIAIDSSEVDGDDASSCSSSRSGGSPTTPSSNGIPLSPREEATKKLYEGLGIGRPVPAISAAVPFTPSFKSTSQPTRQPRGPPSGADELGPKNFATRIRRKAIGGLNVLLESRERRDVEVY